MKKTVILLMILTVLSKILGFGREVTLSYFFGASNISDAYLISLTIPTVIFSFIGIALKTTYIPLYSDIQKNDGNNSANKFTSNVIFSLIIISTFIVLIVLSFTTLIVKLFASGFVGETLELAVQLTRITTVSIYFIGINYIFEAYLQVRKNYVVPAMIGFPLNIIIIISIILGAKSDYKLLGFGQVIGVVLQMIILLKFAHREEFKFNFNFKISLHDKHMWKLLYLSIPVMLGTSVNQINKLIDRTIASNIIEGGVSALVYANRLNLFIQGIFVSSISTVLYPKISKMAAINNLNGLKDNLNKSIRVICIFILPISLGAILFSEPIVKLLFGRGAFGSNEVKLTADALLFYSIGMVGYGLREVVSNAFYSLKDTKTPMMNSAIGVVLNIVLNLILSKYLGIGGLALATSVSAIATTGLLFISFKHKFGSLKIGSIIKDIVKAAIATLIMGIIAKIGFSRLIKFTSEMYALIVSVVLGVIIYATSITLVGITDVIDFIKSIQDRVVNRLNITKQ